MIEITKNVKLLYTIRDEMTVGDLRRFVRELHPLDDGDELDVDIEQTGYAFAIEGRKEEE
jgi:hypothetical protein